MSLIWVLFGFSLAFGDSQGGLIGGLEHAGLRDVDAVVGGDTGIPLQAFAMFQLMFAVVTAALVASAAAERARFWPWALFIGLWTVLVYISTLSRPGRWHRGLLSGGSLASLVCRRACTRP